MLRTRDTVEVGLDVDWSDMKSWIAKRLGEMFHTYPDYFFTEHDIHSLLCDIANEELQLRGVTSTETSDGHQVSLVHHEYPTPFRCDMEGYKFEKKSEPPYKRGHYDLVILNPEFVKKNRLDIVCAKEFEKFEAAMRYVNTAPLTWVCEVVFFPRVKKLPNNAIKIIEQDALKVKETLEHKLSRNVRFSKMGSVLAFTSHTDEESADLERQVKELREKLKLEVTFSTG
jgi:hypothetical protein